MTVRWEYLVLVQEKKVEKRTRPMEPDPDDPFSRWAMTGEPEEEEYFHYIHTFFIWRPGSREAEEREGWSSDNQKRGGYPDILNELGAEGWELVERSTGSSVSGPSRLGWSGAAWPVEIVWTLKRPVEGDG
ncbi:MAG TPA: hypothetical protein VFX35_11925 [Solirubrobacterales bacterium]|nr:hypothetical protein [Solirubrobacterales bacterium]